jgi:hypothetical protein
MYPTAVMTTLPLLKSAPNKVCWNRIHQPARWLFKWDAASFLPVIGIDPQEGGFADGGLRFDAEWKPGVAFSLNASYQLGIDELLSDPDFTHGFRLEPRWYWGMRKRVREGKGASNFSGNYLGLEVMHFSRTGSAEDYLPRLIYRGAMLRVGLQRRILRRGFIDISYGIGMRDYPRTPYRRDETNIFSEARVGLGLAFARPKPVSAGSTSGYCEVLQCFREERRMFKVDLFNLFRVTTTDHLAGTARIALEQKIGYSPFSIELEGQLKGGYSEVEFLFNSDPAKQKFNSYGYGTQLQARYYYNQKRRIATGKSGNNLSGAYLALQANWSQQFFTVKSVLSNGGIRDEFSGRQAQLGSGLVFGVQYRLFERGFIDFNLGGGWGRKFYGDLSSGVKDPIQLQILGALRVGLAF